MEAKFYKKSVVSLKKTKLDSTATRVQQIIIGDEPRVLLSHTLALQRLNSRLLQILVSVVFSDD